MSFSSSPHALTPAAQFLSTTWHALRETHAMPLRRHFTPRLMAEYLSDIFILHHNSKSGIRFRLAGTRLCARHGQELRNQLFSSLWPENDQVLTEEMLHCVASTNTPLCAQLNATSRMQRQNNFELVILPVQHQDDIQWIGAIAAHSEPYWLEADPIINYQMLQSFPITHDNLQAAKVQVNAAYPLETPDRRPSSPKRRAFRIIQGGKQ